MYVLGACATGESASAGPDGELAVRWQCQPGDVGTVWEVMAAGQTSGGSVTFDIQGGE